MTDAHRTNGRVVAQVRRWLEILDNPDEDYGDIKILSRLHGYSGDERELTVHHVRTLLAEHDAYRSEAKAKADTPNEDPFDRLVRLTETHLRLLKAEDFSAPLVDRLRRDDCMHDWSMSKPLRGYDDEIECLECRLRVIDGYRPYYPKRRGVEATP